LQFSLGHGTTVGGKAGEIFQVVTHKKQQQQLSLQKEKVGLLDTLFSYCFKNEMYALLRFSVP